MHQLIRFLMQMTTPDDKTEAIPETGNFFVSSSLKSFSIWKQNVQVCERAWGRLKIISRDIPGFQQREVPELQTASLTFGSHLHHHMKQSWERCLVAFQTFRLVNWAKWMSLSFDSPKKYKNWKPHLKRFHTAPCTLHSSEIQHQRV